MRGSARLLDYPEEFEDVDVKFERPLQHLLGVRFDAKAITKLGEIARKKRIGPSTLARIWIMERLSDEADKEEAKQCEETTSRVSQQHAEFADFFGAPNRQPSGMRTLSRFT